MMRLRGEWGDVLVYKQVFRPRQLGIKEEVSAPEDLFLVSPIIICYQSIYVNLAFCPSIAVRSAVTNSAPGV